MSLTRWKDILECGAAIAVMAGVPLVVLQLKSQTESTRVASALQFVSIYENDGMSAVREKLETAWFAVDAPTVSQARPSPAALSKLQFDVTKGAGITKRDLTRMVDFYNSVISCQDRRICDAKTIDLHFRSDVEGFYCNFQAPLEAVSKDLNHGSYLDTIKAYAGACTDK